MKMLSYATPRAPSWLKRHWWMILLAVIGFVAVLAAILVFVGRATFGTIPD